MLNSGSLELACSPMPLEGPDLYSLNDAGKSGGGQSCFINSLTPRVLSLRRGGQDFILVYSVEDEEEVEETHGKVHCG